MVLRFVAVSVASPHRTHDPQTLNTSTPRGQIETYERSLVLLVKSGSWDRTDHSWKKGAQGMSVLCWRHASLTSVFSNDGERLCRKDKSTRRHWGLCPCHCAVCLLGPEQLKTGRVTRWSLGNLRKQETLGMLRQANSKPGVQVPAGYVPLSLIFSQKKTKILEWLVQRTLCEWLEKRKHTTN